MLWELENVRFLSGGDLSKRIAASRGSQMKVCAWMFDGFSGRVKPFGAPSRVSVALDAACGLSHLHNMTPRVFHRDIKSQNILRLELDDLPTCYIRHIYILI